MSGDPQGGPRRVEGPSWSSGMGRKPLGRSGTGLGTHPEVRDISGTLSEVREGSKDHFRGSRMGWGTLGEV